MKLVRVSQREYSIIYKKLAIGSVDFYVKNKLIYLESLVLYENFRKKGLGAKVVRHLMETCEADLCGNSTYSAIEFWKTVGVEFDECVESCGKVDTVPFTLYY